MVSNPADQEEVVQEVFLQIFRSLGSFKGTSKLSTWIHRVTMNVVLQHIRRKKSRVQLLLETDVSERSGIESKRANTATPEEAVVRRERQAAVKRVLDDKAGAAKRIRYLKVTEDLSKSGLEEEFLELLSKCAS